MNGCSGKQKRGAALRKGIEDQSAVKYPAIVTERSEIRAYADEPFADDVHEGTPPGCCERHRQQELPSRIVAPGRLVADLAKE